MVPTPQVHTSKSSERAGRKQIITPINVKYNKESYRREACGPRNVFHRDLKLVLRLQRLPWRCDTRHSSEDMTVDASEANWAGRKGRHF